MGYGDRYFEAQQHGDFAVGDKVIREGGETEREISAIAFNIDHGAWYLYLDGDTPASGRGQVFRLYSKVEPELVEPEVASVEAIQQAMAFIDKATRKPALAGFIVAAVAQAIDRGVEVPS